MLRGKNVQRALESASGGAGPQLITRRSQVQVLLPQPEIDKLRQRSLSIFFFFVLSPGGVLYWLQESDKSKFWEGEE